MAKARPKPGVPAPTKGGGLARRKARSLGTLLGAPQTHVALLLAAGVLAGVGAWRTERIWTEAGYGLIAPGIAALVLAAGLRFAPALFLRHVHRWLGLCALLFMGWGVLGYYEGPSGVLAETTMGGDMALRILDTPDAAGAWRLAGLGAAGLVLLAPVIAWRVAAWMAIAMGNGLAWAGRTAWAGMVRLADAWRQWRDQRAEAKALAAEEAAALAEEAMAAAEQEGPAEEETGEAGEDEEPKPQREPKKTPRIAAVLGRAPKPVNGAKAHAGGAHRNGEIALESKAGPGGWRLPSIDILDHVDSKAPSPGDNESRARRIEEALASYGIEGSVVEINPGPAVTQFGVEPGWQRKFKEVRVRDAEGKQAVDDQGRPVIRREEISRTRVKVEAIANLDKDMAMALAAPSIRIEAPIPGKSLVGIEVPNETFEVVSLRSTLESQTFQKLRAKTKLPLALGKGSGGEPMVADLAKMPHLLIAGSTGSGKSVCINAVLACILMTATPRDVNLLLVDPKRVEMIPYNSIPHLVTPVIVEADKVVGALKWAMHEMDQRYKRFAAVGARNLEAYNKHRLVVDPLPYLVVAIDELADLMMAAPYEVEHSLIRLAQLGRATGIHLIVATQRPSVDVVTGLIKANFPTRISFAVSSIVDSRTILDSAGAEKLLGKGDMLYLPQDVPKPIRIQGVFVSDREIERLVRAWNSQENGKRPPQIIVGPDGTFAVPGAGGPPPAGQPGAGAPPSAPAAAPSEPQDPEDALLQQARAIAQQSTRLSPSLLSRRLNIGYTKAKRLMEELEAEGYGDSEREEVA